MNLAAGRHMARSIVEAMKVKLEEITPIVQVAHIEE